MTSKKKHFPKNMKVSIPRITPQRKSKAAVGSYREQGKCRNLRLEFDRLISERCIILDDVHATALWRCIALKLINNPYTCIEKELDRHTQIGS
jgi:hypothetical protein